MINPTEHTILVDIDEVLADWVGLLVQEYSAAFPALPCVPQRERTRYDQNIYHPSLEERAALKQILVAPGFYARLAPIDGSQRAMREMQDAGFDVRLCSKPFLSNPTCASDKFAWVERVYGQTLAQRLTLTLDKTLVLGDLLIDDHPAITGHNAAPSWTQIRPTRPHNTGLPGFRFDAWTDWEGVVHAALDQRIAA